MRSLPGQSDSYYKSCFSSGLKEEMVNMVKMAKPQSLADAIEVAKLQEKNLEAIKRAQKAVTQNYSTSPVGIRQTPNSQMKSRWANDHYKRIENFNNRSHKGESPSSEQFKKITPSEFSYRREKGSYYKYAEPYTLGNFCKQAQMQFILVDEHTDNTEITEEESEEFCDCIEGEVSKDKIEVSINALVSGNEHKTIKLKGRKRGFDIGGQWQYSLFP